MDANTMRQLWINAGGEFHGPNVETATMPEARLQQFVDAVIVDLPEYLAHYSWRCRHYQACHCGLDALTDRLGLQRVPYDLSTP